MIILLGIEGLLYNLIKAALFRSIKHTLHCVLYAEDVKDAIFLQESLYSLSLIIEHASTDIVEF